MKVFLDTNVILEFFLRRENGDVAGWAFTKIKEQKHIPFMSVGSFYTILYLVDKFLRKERGLQGEQRLKVLRLLMSNILSFINIAGHDNASLLKGISDKHYKDIEDSCQFYAAQKAGCEILLSFNDADYPVSDDIIPRVMTPLAFVAEK